MSAIRLPTSANSASRDTRRRAKPYTGVEIANVNATAVSDVGRLPQLAFLSPKSSPALSRSNSARDCRDFWDFPYLGRIGLPSPAFDFNHHLSIVCSNMWLQ